MNRYIVYYLLGLSIAASALSVSGQALKPGWHCLPAETALAVRIPDGERFYSAIQGTIIGHHLFGPERVDALLDVARSEGGAEWETFQEELGNLGLSVEDLPSLLRGESGAALLVSSGGGGEPGHPDKFVLFWATPGEEMSGRALQALLRSVEEQESAFPTVRVDTSLAGREVTHLASPQVVHSGGGDPVITHNAHTLLTRTEGRIIGLITLESGPDGETRRRIWEGEPVTIPEPDPEPSETMRDLFARYLRAHDGEDGGFYRQLRTTPGMTEALPTGVPAFESAVNPERLFALMEGSDAALMRYLDAAGVLDLGVTGFRGSLDGNILRWGGLLSAPSPRRGLVETLLGQTELEPRPPAWVSAGVVNYSQFSLDLGQLFARIREISVAVMGDEMEGTFSQVEMQVQSMTQANLVTTLSSLGQRHTFVMFPPARNGVSPGGSQPLDDAIANSMFSDRMALVWAVRDDEVWQRIMQAIGMFAPMTGGALQPSDEQGFSGWRLQNEAVEGGLFLGRGFLAIGAGLGTVEEVLASLRTPPESAYSLAESELYRDAERLLDLRPGLYWEIQNLGRQMGEAAVTLSDLLTIASDGDPGGMPEGVVAFLESILDADLIREAYGVGVTQVFAARDGLVMESAQELTPVSN